MTLHSVTTLEAEQRSQAATGGDSDTGYRATARHQIETLEILRVMRIGGECKSRLHLQRHCHEAGHSPTIFFLPRGPTVYFDGHIVL